MPDINGFEVLEQMKQKEELRRIPVIVHTAADLESAIVEKMGIKNYLIKPIAQDELLIAVEKAFKFSDS